MLYPSHNGLFILLCVYHKVREEKRENRDGKFTLIEIQNRFHSSLRFPSLSISLLVCNLFSVCTPNQKITVYT